MYRTSTVLNLGTISYYYVFPRAFYTHNIFYKHTNIYYLLQTLHSTYPSLFYRIPLPLQNEP
jgi:hypothetical protein